VPVDGRATQDSTESTFTTAPPPLRASTGANALVTFTGPKKLVSISARAAFSDGPSSDPPPAIPALSIRRVTSGASSAAAATDAPGRTRPAARGRGHASAAYRVEFPLCSPTCPTTPPITSSISAGSSPGSRSTALRMAWACRSTGWTSAYAPPGLPLPTGVRTASTITTSRIGSSSL
jgi:hypothetical protein